MSSSVSAPPPRLISDELWALVEPSIPPGRPFTAAPDGHGGLIARCWRASRSCCRPGSGGPSCRPDLGHGSGWTCWGRMREWAETGVFDRLHRAVLDRLGERGRLD
jgi:transposase